MSVFQVVLTPEAQIDIERLHPTLQTRLLNKLEWIGESAELLRHQPLHGKEWTGCFKYRIGDYRIIYQIDWSAEKMLVLKVGHRREVYG
jgi:mRNA interferase RelE/StbE